MADNEKAAGETKPLLAARRQYTQRRRATATILSFLVIGALLANLYWSSRAFYDSEENDEEDKEPAWNWQEMKSHKSLKWESCYDGRFECARLDVPMDWQKPSKDNRVVLGVIKLAAKSQLKDAAVPPLFVNPGGPGGSGVNILLRMGEEIQNIAGDYHDVISWDPRGVGVSTPRADCWGSFQKRSIWDLQSTPVVDERPGLIYDAYSRAAALSSTCEDALAQTGILFHLSTAYTARDLLELVKQTGNRKLRYWGFSYGTILAGVFASMYPDSIERLVSDGNVDYKGWFELDHSNFVKDADALLDIMDEACYKAGPKKCELWQPSPTEIRNRRGNILEKLKKQPLVVPPWATAEGPEMPELVTYSSLQSLTRGYIYKPTEKIETFARVYAALDRGDPIPYYEATRNSKPDPMSKLLCSNDDIPATEPHETAGERDALPAIMCSDAEPFEATPEDLAVYMDKLKSVSKWTGAASILFRLPCVGRTARPKWRVVPKEHDKVETSHPILFVNNLYDNVTPLESARNNSAHFPGSVVLQQNTLGHCSIAAPSTCTAKHIQAYFKDGSLPKEGTECEQDYGLFEKPGADTILALDDLASSVWRLSQKGDFDFWSQEEKRGESTVWDWREPYLSWTASSVSEYYV